MRSKRGQLSYEYIIVIGMILVLLIPFFYNLFISLSGRVSEYFASEAVNIIADGTQTVANLGPKNTMQVNVRLQGAKSNGIDGKNTVSITLDSGEEVYATGANSVYAGLETLTGTGYFTVPIATITDPIGSIGVGSQPIITCVAPASYDPKTGAKCPNRLRHNDRPWKIYGKNFNMGAGGIAIALNVDGNPPSGMSAYTISPDYITMISAIGRQGIATVNIANPASSSNPGTSKTITFPVTP